METTVNAIVADDHSIHVVGLPFEPGDSVRVVIDRLSESRDQEERREFVARYFGKVQDPAFDVPDSSASVPIEPIA